MASIPLQAASGLEVKINLQAGSGFCCPYNTDVDSSRNAGAGGGRHPPDVSRQLGREARYQQPQRLVARGHDATLEVWLLLFGWVGFVQCIYQDDDLGSATTDMTAPG
jgi:hypothetical protein